jgi:hypothetical protein
MEVQLRWARRRQVNTVGKWTGAQAPAAASDAQPRTKENHK